MKRALFIGAIVSVLTLNAFAETTTSTIPTQSYVDTQDALKQDLIDATDQDFPAGSVVETTDENGAVTQRGICNAHADGYGDCMSDFLVTRDLLQSATNSVENNLPTTTVTYKTCVGWSGTPHTDANCILWNLADKPVYGNCTSNSDCNSVVCEDNEAWARCSNGRCECVIL
ncbi:MAG: hypothetical protein J5620_01495 [Alphaproteobacteria bacterium]|nr:hypothetical protein [Alphaproteobacteria bacterium]